MEANDGSLQRPPSTVVASTLLLGGGWSSKEDDFCEDWKVFLMKEKENESVVRGFKREKWWENSR